MISEDIRIPYDEHRAINSLLKAHLQTHEMPLRALIVFGPLVTRGGTYDIDLLEVVTGWTGPISVAFSSTPDLPLRGVLRLNILTPQQFEEPDQAARDILARVRLGYQIIYEEPTGYAERTLTGANTAVISVNPLTFLDSSLPRQAA